MPPLVARELTNAEACKTNLMDDIPMMLPVTFQGSGLDSAGARLMLLLLSSILALLTEGLANNLLAHGPADAHDAFLHSGSV